jgi:hypothetical protein
LLFLNKCNGDVDKTLELLVKHYEIKRRAPQLFRNRDVSTIDVQQGLENQYFISLPQTRDCTLCYFGLQNPLARNFFYNNSTTCFLMMIGKCLQMDIEVRSLTVSFILDVALSKYGPSKGLILIYDMKNFRFSHLTRNNLKSMKSFFSYMQEGLPLNIEEIHIFNTFSSFNLIMKIIAPFMRAEIVKKVIIGCLYLFTLSRTLMLHVCLFYQMHLHPTNVDLEKFHASFLSISCLPSDSDFGGVCGSVDELHKKHCDELLEMREYFIAEEKQVFDES